MFYFIKFKCIDPQKIYLSSQNLIIFLNYIDDIFSLIRLLEKITQIKTLILGHNHKIVLCTLMEKEGNFKVIKVVVQMGSDTC